MKAMIFAAGLGTRLKPFTLTKPKALVEVKGVPMLRRVIEGLADAGISRMVVNIHHHGQCIVDYLEANNNFGLDIKISDERALLLDTGGGLLKAANLFGEDNEVLLHNADIFTDLDYRQMMDAHRAAGADATLLATERNSSRRLWFDRDNRMKGWGNISTNENRPVGLDTSLLHPLSFGGIHIINLKNILPRLRSFGASKGNGTIDPVFSITDFYIENCGNFLIRSYTPDNGLTWLDVGKPETLEKANSLPKELVP